MLTSPPAPMFDDVPTFSPDGGSIAFVRARSYFHRDLYTMPVEGGTPARLTRDDAAIAGQLAWSPDGQIIFSSDRAGSASLLRVPAAGGSPVPLPVFGESPAPPHSTAPAGGSRT